jgi:hypothetical protein
MSDFANSSQTIAQNLGLKNDPVANTDIEDSSLIALTKRTNQNLTTLKDELKAKQNAQLVELEGVNSKLENPLEVMVLNQPTNAGSGSTADEETILQNGNGANTVFCLLTPKAGHKLYTFTIPAGTFIAGIGVFQTMDTVEKQIGQIYNLTTGQLVQGNSVSGTGTYAVKILGADTVYLKTIFYISGTVNAVAKLTQGDFTPSFPVVDQSNNLTNLELDNTNSLKVSHPTMFSIEAGSEANTGTASFANIGLAGQNTVAFTVSGTFIGTLKPRLSIAGAYVTPRIYKISDGSEITGGLVSTGTNVNGQYAIQTYGALNCDFQVSPLTSGSATVAYIKTPASFEFKTSSSSPIAGFSLETTQQDVKTQIGALNETAPTTDTASSGLNGRLQRLAQRLTSIFTALTDRSQFTKITDGTNNATIKPALTLAVATDTALVVQTHPSDLVNTTLASILAEMRDDRQIVETVWYDKLNPTLFYVRRATVDEDTGTVTIGFFNVDGTTASPTIANLVQVIATSDIETVTYSYKVVTAGTGYAIDDKIQELQMVSSAGVVQATVWFNRTQNTVLATAPTFTHLAIDNTVQATTDASNGSITGGVVGSKSSLAGAVFLTTPPALTNNQQVALQVDAGGNLKTVNQGAINNNQTQIGGVAVTTNSGLSGTGTQRVVLANRTETLIGAVNSATQTAPAAGQRIKSLLFTNNTASVIFLQIHDKASALVLGDTPLSGLIFRVPANSTLDKTVADFGEAGILYGANTRIGLSSTFATFTAIASATNTSYNIITVA